MRIFWRISGGRSVNLAIRIDVQPRISSGKLRVESSDDKETRQNVEWEAVDFMILREKQRAGGFNTAGIIEYHEVCEGIACNSCKTCGQIPQLQVSLVRGHKKQKLRSCKAIAECTREHLNTLGTIN